MEIQASTDAPGAAFPVLVLRSLHKFPSQFGQHILGIGVPRLRCSFKALYNQSRNDHYDCHYHSPVR